MKIRYQLFLIIGSLFFLCYFIALTVQESVAKDSIEKGHREIVAQLEVEHRAKQQRIKDFLTSNLAEKFSQIETLLMTISSYPPQVEMLLNASMSWENLGEILYANKWLSFLKSSCSGSDNALLLDRAALSQAKVIARAKDDPSILKIDSQGQEHVGIIFPFDALNTNDAIEIKGPITCFLLFTKEQIQNLAGAHLQKEKAKEWTPLALQLENLIVKASTVTSWQESVPAKPVSPSKDPEIQQFDVHLSRTIALADQVVMARLLSEMAALNLFGPTLKAPNFPAGIAVFSEKDVSGYSLKTDQVLYQGIGVDKVPIDALSDQFTFLPSVFVVSKDSLFIGSTLEVQAEEKKAELTLGIGLKEMVLQFAQELDMPVFCVLNGKIFLQGTKWDTLLANFPIEQADSKDYGVIDVDQESIFFMRMKPIPGIDLEFFAVNYAAREFAFLNFLDQGVRHVLSQISKQMWLVSFIAMALALLIFNRLAKRITDPVAKLATAAASVSRGKLTEVDLPKMKINRHDEIHTLYSSFDDMVRSLQEKEKVRATLNKVVSPVIASEILKSEMQLGGEKKRVCIFFADIRGFTKITESMSPEQVIEMLNHCMTRVSHVIDEHKGIIDKYVGDEAMALFGIPNPSREDGLRAVEAAIEVQKLLEEWNKERVPQGKQKIEMGIGIEIGDVLAGNMGAIDRQNYTVLGKHVNIASRLCSIAAPGQILVTEAIASSPGVKERYQLREVGKEALKGLTESVIVFEVKFK